MSRWIVTAVRGGPQMIQKEVYATDIMQAIDASGLAMFEIIKVELVGQVA